MTYEYTDLVVNYIKHPLKNTYSEIRLDKRVEKMFVPDYFSITDGIEILSKRILSVKKLRRDTKKPTAANVKRFILTENIMKNLKYDIFMNMKNHVRNEKTICSKWDFRLASIKNMIMQKANAKAIEIKVKIY